mmetsp:Transcript_46296/g.59511  ORF Transcript_46296/g.59511 Transcript_46296/m.59511 type:complete len:489 (-) Transcript_46296:76-1542(-)
MAETRKEMYERLQDAAFYERIKAAADLVKTGGGSVEMKGYSKVGTNEDVHQPEEVEDIGNVDYWTSVEVCEYLRERLLEYEGADEETVTELLSTFEEREVDGRTLMQLDDQTLRYELDIGALVVRETILRIIKHLRDTAIKKAASEEPLKRAMATGGKKGKGKSKNGYDRVGMRDDDSDDGHDYDDDDDDDEKDELDALEDDNIAFFGKVPKSKKYGESSERASRRKRLVANHKKGQVLVLIRVLAAISSLSLLYCMLSQSLESWHSRMVTMTGTGEKIQFGADMGLWSFTSTGHYHNDNMYSNIMPGSEGFGWTDDYSVSDTYDHSKWQCKPPSNKSIKDFCSFIRAAQACSVLTLICCLSILIHSLVSVSYGRPLGCSRVMALVSLGQGAFSVASLLCADGAFTEQLRRYGDETITASQCKTHYLSYAREADDDWYDDDWGFNRLVSNDDHFDVANVRCGYSVAFVLACFVPFFSVIQVILSQIYI